MMARLMKAEVRPGILRDEGWRIEIGEMVGHEDARSICRHAVASFHFNANARDPVTEADDEVARRCKAAPRCR